MREDLSRAERMARQRNDRWVTGTWAASALTRTHLSYPLQHTVYRLHIIVVIIH